MNELFREIQPGELVLAVSNFKLRGKAKYVFAMLRILATTELIEQDRNRDWWQAKAWIMTQDGGRVRKYQWDNEEVKKNTPY